MLEGADRILRKDGYEAASTNRIARVAGFSVGSLYQYFDDKQAVVGALIDRFLRKEAENLSSGIEGLEPQALEESVPQLIERIAQTRWTHGHLLTTLEQNEEELCQGPALSYVLRVQAPVNLETLHRFAAPLYAEAAGDALEERLFCIFRTLHAVTFAHAVDAPAYVDVHQLAGVLAGLVVKMMSASGEPSEKGRAFLATLAGSRRTTDSPAARRRRVAQDARTRLLQEDVAGPGELEPVVLVAAALPEVLSQATSCGGVRPAQVDSECARLADLLLTPARSEP